MSDHSAIRHILTDDRRATEARIAQMSADLDALAAATAGSNADDEHDPEGSTVAFEREQLAALRVRAQERLGEVADALDRLDDGSYGRCATCGEPIGAERLAARPVARHCVRCAARSAPPPFGG